MTRKRQMGFYWVKLPIIKGWTIAQYTGNNLWYILGEEHEYKTKEFKEIGERIIKKRKKKK